MSNYQKDIYINKKNAYLFLIMSLLLIPICLFLQQPKVLKGVDLIMNIPDAMGTGGGIIIVIFRIIIFAAIIILLATAIRSVLYIFYKKPLFTIDLEGFHDKRLGSNFGVVKWDEIDKLIFYNLYLNTLYPATFTKTYGGRYLGLIINDPNKFVMKKNKKININFKGDYKAHINIPMNLMDISEEELKKIISNFSKNIAID